MLNYKYAIDNLTVQLDQGGNGIWKQHVSSNLTNTKSSQYGVSQFDEVLQKLWNDADKKQLFRYSFKELPSRIISDKFMFMLQLNPERASKRRKPQEIKDVNQPFNPKEFNFNKVKPEEIIMTLTKADCDSDSVEVSHCSILINVSPLEYCNVLLVPFPEQNQPQCITKEGLKIAVEMSLLSYSTDFRVGFNSLCGHASVNHHHYHAYYLKHRLYIEYAELKQLAGPCLEFKNTEYPAPGFIFILKDTNELDSFLDSCCQLISFLQLNNIGHNLYMTRGSSLGIKNHFDCIRLLVWGRTSSCGAKVCDAFNPALCELAGHFPIKNETSYSTMTEDFIINELEGICRTTFTTLKSQVINLLWKDNESFVTDAKFADTKNHGC